MRWIYVLSPQHTATWFLLSYLRDHPDIDGFTQVGSPQVTLRRTEALFHELKSDGTVRLQESIGSLTTILHSHICLAEGRPFRLHRFQEALAVVANPVIPLRDPVSALLTTVNRGDPSPLDDEIRRWVGMITSLRDLDPLVQPIYFPVDLWKQENKRQAALGYVLTRLELKNAGHARRWAVWWPLGINSSGSYESKRRYAAGDIEYIKAHHPDVWEAVANRRGTLQPFFVERGYESLPWYA